MSDALRILLADDSPEDRELIRRTILGEFPGVRIIELTSPVDLETALAGRAFDVVVTDYWMGWTSGLDLLHAVRAVDDDCPVVMVTGTGNEEIAVAAMKSGLSDYILKRPSHLARLPAAIRSTLAQRDERRARRAAEAAAEASRRFAEHLLDASPGIIYIYDLIEQRNVYVSRRAEQILGYTPTEILEMGPTFIARVCHPEDVERLARLVGGRYAELPVGEAVTNEYRARHQKGEWRWFRSHDLVLTRTPEGLPWQLLRVAYDITSERLIQEEMREQHQFLDALVQSAPDIIYVFDVVERRITYINGRVESVLGFSPEDVIRMGADVLTTILPADSLARLPDLIASAQTAPGSRPIDAELRVRDRSGNERWVRGHATVFQRAADGSIRQLLATALDVTEQRMAGERERLLTAALTAAANGIVITNRAGMIQWVNPAFTRITGYAAHEVVGQNPRLLKSGAQDDAFYANLWRTILDGRVWRGTVVNRRKDGSQYTEEMTITPVAADGGGHTHFVAVKQDVSERVEREHVLQSSGQRLDLALRGADLGLWDFNIKTDHVFFNERWASMLGYTLTELEPLNGAWKRLLHPDDRDRVLEAFNEHLAGATPFYEAEFRLGARSGDWVWVYSRGQVVERDTDGHPVRVTGTHLDVTTRKQTEVRLRAQDDQLRQVQRMDAVGQLAGGIAHDFNNLLTAILGYCDLLLDATPEGDERRPDVIEIRDAGERAAALTRQLLAFSRRQVFDPKVVDLTRVVTGLEKMLRRLVRENIRVEYASPAEPLYVRVDQGQIEQVLMNLAVNAADAMPDGGTLWVETGVHDVDQDFVAAHLGARPGRHITLTVGDTGTGMTPDLQAHIFEPFFTTKPQGKGTGLGLATVYGIVKQSGGFIWVDSLPGQGARFTIQLPPAPEGEPASEPPVRPNSVHRRRGETILVVEDDLHVRQLVTKVLHQHGYRVVAAEGVAEARQRCAEAIEPFAVLLTDVIMPEMSGPELAAELRAFCPDQRVILMSGYSDAATRDLIARGGATAFLPKPFEAETLVRKIEEALGHSRGEP